MAMNAWVEGAADRAAAMALLGRAAAALRQRGLRMSVNAWVEAAEESARRRAPQRLRLAGGARATRRALNSWRAMVDERAMMRRAGASMRQRGCGRR